MACSIAQLTKYLVIRNRLLQVFSVRGWRRGPYAVQGCVSTVMGRIYGPDVSQRCVRSLDSRVDGAIRILYLSDLPVRTTSTQFQGMKEGWFFCFHLVLGLRIE